MTETSSPGALIKPIKTKPLVSSRYVREVHSARQLPEGISTDRTWSSRKLNDISSVQELLDDKDTNQRFGGLVTLLKNSDSKVAPRRCAQTVRSAKDQYQRLKLYL